MNIPLGSVARSSIAKHSIWVKTGKDNGKDGWVWIDKHTGEISDAAHGDEGMMEDGAIWIVDPDQIYVKRKRLRF